MNPKNMLSERSQIQIVIYCMTRFIQDNRIGDSTEKVG